MIVHQALSGAGPHDAVTNEAREFRTLFGSWGWGGVDVSAAVDPRIAGEFLSLGDFRPQPGELVLIHYSAYAPNLRGLLEAPVKRLVLYHNITPARYFWDHSPEVAIQCAVGRRELADFVKAADLVAGDSEYNCEEARAAGAERTVHIPILFHRERLGPAGSPRTPDPAAPRLLFVGRLVPSKRQDELIRTVAQIRRTWAPGATLSLVGTPLSPRFRDQLAGLADRLAPGAVTIESGLEPDELWRRYRDADVFLCLSEHEGFCVPLLESFHFGVPVVARPSGGVPEVAGDAALLVEDRDPGVIAELVRLAVGDPDLRAELARRGEARLDVFSAQHTAERLRAAIESLA